MSRAFAALQRSLPQHGLSRAAGWLARAEAAWIRDPLIRTFASAYGVELSEAAREALTDYSSFNDFFTRELKAGARPICADPDAVVSPADGTVSQAGRIEDGQLLQAKGHTYRLETLIGMPVPRFEGGLFATVYLAPSNYHRVHLPLAGTLTRTRAVPGALYSVNAATETAIEGLFARNERLVCHFDTAHGEMLVVLVGAMIVASIETVWPGPSSPYRAIEDRSYAGTAEKQVFQRGAEIGRFLLGSTAIVCLERDAAVLEEKCRASTSVRMGEVIARLR